MPRILITGFFSLPGPSRAGVQMQHVLRALAREHTIDVLVVRHGDQAYVERRENCRILRVPIAEGEPRAQMEAFRRALRRQLDGAEYEIIHFRDGWSGIPVLELRDRLEYATVFDATRAPLAEGPMLDLELSAELNQAEMQCAAQADLVLVPTEAALAHIAQSRPERSFLVPCGVDVDHFDWDEATGVDGAPIILYAGTMDAGRGVRLLLRSMVYVNRRVSTKLVLAGYVPQSFAQSLRNMIDDLGLADQVEVLGEVAYEDMPALIARASVCVAPAAPEARTQPMALYPTKLLEYMACRRAVIAPRRGSISALLANGAHGLVFTPGDPADLARQIIRLLEDSELRSSLADAGYQLVRQMHTASATRRAVRQAYASLLARVPWASKFAGVKEATMDGPSLAEDVTDHTDEYELPFTGEERAEPVTVGEFTRVEQRPLAPEPGWATISAEIPLPAKLDTSDEWVLTDPGHPSPVIPTSRRRDPTLFVTEPDDEGTPIDVKPVSSRDSLAENRFVAGEVEVNTPRPEPVDDASFTAVSVLLGNLSDDTDGTGRKEPG